MTRPIPYLFCRYSLSISGNNLSGAEQYGALRRIRGQPVAYRKRFATAADRDTFAMRPRRFDFDGEAVVVWCVGHDILFRDVANYRRDDDEIEMTKTEGDGIRYSTFIAVPRIGALAVDDRTSDVHMGGIRAVRRFVHVFRQIKGGRADIRLAANWNDVNSALENWALTEFSFSVRPFNPSPRRPGEKIHEMMRADGIGVLLGIAKPAKGETMQKAEDGYISEAVGLAQTGYGQIGARGYTPEGYEAKYGKPRFSTDKRENEKERGKAQALKVYFPPRKSEREHIGEVAKALLGFYDRRTKAT